MHEVQRAQSKMKLGRYGYFVAILATCLAAERPREPRQVYELDLIDTDLPDSNHRNYVDNNLQYFGNPAGPNVQKANAPTQQFPIRVGWVWNANTQQNNAINNRQPTSNLVTFPPSEPTIQQLSRNILLRQLAVRPMEVTNNNLPHGFSNYPGQDRTALAKGLLTFPLPPEIRRQVFSPLQLPVQADVNVAIVASPSSLSPVITNLHGPIAMGSGSLGYARTVTGALAIGSGAIGYTSFEVLRNPVIRNV